MASYDLRGKCAIVTGAGSGINHAISQRLLGAGCSVMFADVRLRPEAQATVDKHPHPSADASKPSAVFKKTDVSDWPQLTSLWESALATFGRVDVVVNGAGIYEPPSTSFWNPPGISPVAEDPVDAKVGQYKIFAVNTIAPIRLAQMATDYWLENRDVQGNMLWVASMGGYGHGIQSPLYFASKAAVVSMVKSLGPLRQVAGIRNSALCPGAVFTPLFDQDHCRGRLRPDDIALTAEQCAEVAMRVLQEPQHGHGDIVETQLIEADGETEVDVREVPLEALYSSAGVFGQAKHAIAEQDKFVKQLGETGMRS